MIFFYLVITFLLLLAILFVIYPLRKKLHEKFAQKLILSLSALLICASFFVYYQLGNAQGLHNAILFQQLNMLGETGEKQSEFLQQLKSGLTVQLKKHPDDPITWALLAKIYFTQKDYAKARDTFAQAYALLPNDPDLLIDYVTAAYLANNGQLDPELEALLAKVLKLEPTLGSLSLLANVALDQGDIAGAVSYWKQMQAQVPVNSDLYRELELTIQFATR